MIHMLGACSSSARYVVIMKTLFLPLAALAFASVSASSMAAETAAKDAKEISAISSPQAVSYGL